MSNNFRIIASQYRISKTKTPLFRQSAYSPFHYCLATLQGYYAHFPDNVYDIDIRFIQ